MRPGLYVGTIEHRRFLPVRNDFTYSVCYYFLDVDHIPSLFNIPFLKSYDFPGLFSFWRKDYIGQRNESIRESVTKIIRKETGEHFQGPIRLLTNISYFGYCFNPVSFYYCYDEDGVLKYVVSEVTNTPWGEKHQDFVRFQGHKGKETFHLKKDFHVSPFLPMDMDYTWVLSKPDDSLYILMQNRHQGESTLIFDSTLELKREELTFFNMMKNFMKVPLVSLKTTLAIYYQAAILYFVKKIPFYPHPDKG